MGRNNRRGLVSSGSKKHKLTGRGSRPQGITKTKPESKKSPGKPRSSASTQHQHSQPTLPFSPHERILLIGEGDLSFARSLVEHHGCGNITATVYESEAEVREKYPQVAESIEVVESGGGSVKYNVDATKMKPWVEGKGGGFSGKGIMDRIFFNFPHVGGKSKDVNRQVRYNQELLVSFFRNAVLSLSPKIASSIVVTLFEGEPYTLWNIRDLGRHSGLQVERSFKFQATAYPGYKHARTLGIVKSKNGEAGAGWKGEERSARSFVFVRKGEAPPPGHSKSKELELEYSEEEEVLEDFDELESATDSAINDEDTSTT